MGPDPKAGMWVYDEQSLVAWFNASMGPDPKAGMWGGQSGTDLIGEPKLQWGPTRRPGCGEDLLIPA